MFYVGVLFYNEKKIVKEKMERAQGAVSGISL